MKTYISCPSPFMCRHIQPKKNPKNPKLGSSPRPARRRCARRRASSGLEPNLGFFGFLFRLYMAAHKKGRGRKYMVSYVFIGFPCFYKGLHLLHFTFYLLPSTFYL